MFDGLGLAERRALASPPSHPVRRVVMISDGMANIGPSSPEVLGAVAARGSDGGVQVSAIGVGLDYDERTLNALAVRSSGRLYHLDEPREMTAILDREIGLLQATAATGAYVEIVPAPGVTLQGADGVRFDWQGGGAARVPLGTMFGGQHREMVLRVRVDAGSEAGEGGRALASVRLHFHDPADGGVERVQEVVARFQVTSDHARVEAQRQRADPHHRGLAAAAADHRRGRAAGQRRPLRRRRQAARRGRDQAQGGRRPGQERGGQAAGDGRRLPRHPGPRHRQGRRRRPPRACRQARPGPGDEPGRHARHGLLVPASPHPPGAPPHPVAADLRCAQNITISGNLSATMVPGRVTRVARTAPRRPSWLCHP